MPLYQLAVLAAVQGITEFLPISSSGHLVLAEGLLGVPAQGLVLTVAVHVGTLVAVIAYFWRDVGRIAAGALQLALGRRTDAARLAGHLAVATIPIVIVGFVAREHVAAYLRSAELIAWTTLGFGVLLYAADRAGMTLLKLEHLGVGHALVIGAAQVLALVPGTSRSGITITAARLLGYERSDAARLAMLMSIPVIAGAGLLVGLDLRAAGETALTRDAAIAAALSCAVALGAIWFLMSWVRRAGVTIFVVYRLIVGLALLYWLYA